MLHSKAEPRSMLTVMNPTLLSRFIRPTALAALGAALLASVPSQADSVFTVRQSFAVTNVPAGAKQVRAWFWMPEDGPDQRVLDFKLVEAPATVKITRDPGYGRSWIYAEGPANAAQPLTVVTEFKILREAISGRADAAMALPLGEAERRAFTAELRKDEKHIEVTPEIQRLADKLAGAEKNPVAQARTFYDYVIENSEHYSKTGGKVKGLGLGSATECLKGLGDTCTDQHALFMALCRARGIPCRLMFGSRLAPANEGKVFDPGYRCWPNFYAAGLGWVPVDVSSGDNATADQAGNWFGGLDEHRLEWAEGRDFQLSPPSAVRPDLVIRGWVEIDGQPRKDFSRTVHFTREARPAAASPKTAAK